MLKLYVIVKNYMLVCSVKIIVYTVKNVTGREGYPSMIMVFLITFLFSFAIL